MRRQIGLTALKFAAVAMVSVLLLTLLLNTMRNGTSGETRLLNADFSDVSGLRVGDDVRVAGVRVGRVSSIEVTADGARVGLDVEQAQPVLDTTTVVMRYQNLIGQRYLALVEPSAAATDGPETAADTAGVGDTQPQTQPGEPLAAGATIPRERTDPGFDLTTLLNGFRPLFEVLQPADVNRLSTTIVRVLQGEGGTVEQLLRETARLTTFLADRDQLYGQVADNLTPVLENLAGQGDQLRSTVVELESLMTALARDRRSIGASIDGVSRLVGVTSDLLRDARTPTVRAVDQLVVVARVLAQTRGDLNAALRSFTASLASFGRPGSYENALNVYLCTLYLKSDDGREVAIGGGDGPWSEICR